MLAGHPAMHEVQFPGDWRCGRYPRATRVVRSRESWISLIIEP